MPVYGCSAIQIESVSALASPVGIPSYDLLRDPLSGLVAIVCRHRPPIFCFSWLFSRALHDPHTSSRPTPTRSSETVIYGLRRVPTA